MRNVGKGMVSWTCLMNLYLGCRTFLVCYLPSVHLLWWGGQVSDTFSLGCFLLRVIPVCGLSFYSPNCVFEKAEVLNFTKVEPIKFSFHGCVFWCCFWGFSADPEHSTPVQVIDFVFKNLQLKNLRPRWFHWWILSYS